MPLELREEVTSLSEVMLCDHNYIAVGTALLSEDQDDDLIYEENIHPAKTGRLLLLDPVVDRSTGSWTLNIITQLGTIGAVNDITVIHEFLAYAAASKVSIMKFEDNSLNELSSFSSTFIAHSLFTAPPSKYQAEEKLIVGDGMRSVLMLEIDDESGMIYGDDRDMATHQVVALAGIKDRGQGVVVADVSH
jgi:DNA damage-binding protein 1